MSSSISQCSIWSILIGVLLGISQGHYHPILQGCRCATIQECGDGGGFIKPRINETECGEGRTYCCVILPQPPLPPPPRCGIYEPVEVPGFAYGSGNIAFHQEFPWLVKILGGPDGRVLGAGALIDSHRVLTVAHLVQNERGNPRLRVVVGMHTEIVFVHKIVIHNDYNWVNLHNDIAILHLEKGLDLSNLFPSVGKVCLPTSEGLFKEHKERCVLSTFGENGYPIIRKIDMNIMSSETCQVRMRVSNKVGPGFLLDQSFICAGGVEQGQDACEGQGGSPLVCKINGQYHLAGLVSWGITKADCSDRGMYPGVYLNVSKYRNWIG